MSNLEEIDLNLTTPAYFAGEEFNETFRILRAQDPVHWTEGNYGRGYWSITKYVDCVTVLENAALFNSSEGSHLPPTPPSFTEEERHVMGFGSKPTHTDPPRHMTMRRPFNKHFSAPAVQRFRDKCVGAVEAIIADVGPRGACDIVEDVAAQLPVALVLDMMGIPHDDWAMIRQYCVTYMSAQDPEFQVAGDPARTKIQASKNLFDYVLDLAMKRRAQPTDDFTSLIATMEIEGGLMSERDVGWWCFSMVAAGLETTRNAAALGIYELIRRPEQAKLWRADQSLGPTATEEVLRWATPSKHKLRVATEDTELGGKSIRKGDWVVVWLTSANRDETIFDRPDEFNIQRTPNRHLAFGAGEHVCLGRHLARLEIQLLVPRVLQMFPDMQLDGPVEYLASDNTNALKRLPVRYSPIKSIAA